MSADTPGLFYFEEQLLAGEGVRLAGVDEAGRGPLAGPVVAAAVILPAEWVREGLPVSWRGLNDSKQLTPRRREAFFELISGCPQVETGVAVVEADEIDRVNILRASHEAMVSALSQLTPPPDHVLVDGLPVALIPWPQTAVVGGDARSYSIAAASVLAKVTRDRLMLEHDRRWPEYGFATHKGYPTAAHRDALRRLGPCAIHRRSFAPVRAAGADLFGA